MAISGRQLRFCRGFPVIRPGTARLPRPLRGLAMTRQGGTAVHQRPYAVELSRTRRSLTAATDAIGAYHFNGSRYESAVPPPRLPRAQSALAMTIWGAFTILTIACTGGRCVAGRGMPRPYFFTHTGAADKCPSPRRKQADFRGKSFKKLLHSGYFSVIIRTIYSRLY